MGLIRFVIKRIIKSGRKGNTKITKDTQINGDVEGNVTVSNGATLIVNGDVEGNITGGNVQVKGDVEGGVF